MKHLINRLETISGSIIAAIHRLGETSKANITAVGIAYTTVIGFIQFTTTRGMSFDFFYVLGSAFTGWGRARERARSLR